MIISMYVSEKPERLKALISTSKFTFRFLNKFRSKSTRRAYPKSSKAMTELFQASFAVLAY